MMKRIALLEGNNKKELQVISESTSARTNDTVVTIKIEKGEIEVLASELIKAIQFATS